MFQASLFSHCCKLSTPIKNLGPFYTSVLPTAKMSRSLAVFDFDYTIVDDNSDTAMVGIIGKQNIPQEVKDLHQYDGWTAFMQGVFTLLHEKGIDQKTIKECITQLPPVDGMINLLQELKKTGTYDTIIISDSNDYFINVYLEKFNLADAVFKVFTNPSEWVNGLLKIAPYHDQTSCKLSTRNLCKGQVLDEFVDEQRKNGVLYDHVMYVGDGVNDFCPSLRLRSNDLVCAREKFKLIDLIVESQSGESRDSSGKLQEIKAEVLVWNSGNDIIKKIKK